jgi:hypothetical protein
MVVVEGFNREGGKGRREKKNFVLGILLLQGVALAAREMRNSIVARDCLWFLDVPFVVFPALWLARLRNDRMMRLHSATIWRTTNASAS